MIKKDFSLKNAFAGLKAEMNLPGNISQKLFSKGAFVIHQGNRAEAVHLIHKGVVKCFITESNGREYIVEFLGEGEFLGDLEILIGRPCLCTVQAMTELTVFKLKADLYFDMIEKGGELAKLMMQQLASRLHRTSGRASYQQIYPIEYALLKLLASLQENEVIIKKQDLSDYLAIPVRSLNRNLGKLSDDDMIRIEEQKITICSEKKLHDKLAEYHV